MLKTTFIAAVAALLTLSACSNSSTPKTQTTKKHEADYVDEHCQGEVEFSLPDRTRVDCLTDTHAIEYDWGKKWAEAIGQSLFYSAMTSKKAGIVLIVNDKSKARYLKRLNTTIEAHGLD
jgi:hypothetical protein